MWLKGRVIIQIIRQDFHINHEQRLAAAMERKLAPSRFRKGLLVHFYGSS